MALVKNIQGSSDNTPYDGSSSWKEYWEERKGRKFSYCSHVGCFQLAEVGGHVKKVHGTGEWYIIPLCSKCNNYANTDPYEVNDADLLRVN